MGFTLEDGTGQGYRVKISAENQMHVQAENHELQHHISILHGQVYQAIGTHTLTTSGAKTILHLKNDDPERMMVVSYMRLQFPGGDGTIDNDTYFQLGYGTTYSAGGAGVTPINMNSSSGNLATITAYHDNPTVTGSLDVFDHWYADNGMMTFNKHGSIVMGLGDTLEFRLQTDQSTGLVYVRCTFMMYERDAIG